MKKSVLIGWIAFPHIVSAFVFLLGLVMKQSESLNGFLERFQSGSPLFYLILCFHP